MDTGVAEPPSFESVMNIVYALAAAAAVGRPRSTSHSDACPTCQQTELICRALRGALVLLGFAVHVIYYTMVPVDATKGGKTD